MLAQEAKSKKPAHEFKWAEWKKRFAQAEDLPTLSGLIHCAYQVSRFDHEAAKDRNQLMLELANREALDAANPLEDLAFQVLSQNLFREKVGFHLNPIMMAAVEPILHFFRPTTDGHEGDGLWNLRRWTTHRSASEQAEKFLLEICDGIWKGHFYPERRPEVLRILCAHRKLKRIPLGGQGNYLTDTYWECFDEASIAELERLALLQHPTVEDAIVHNCKPAQMVVIARIGLAEQKRRKEQEALEQEILAQQRRLSELKKS